jgi:hypothetical protein
MTYLYEELKAPTRLYIKQCSHCQLKYFGKTTSETIESYEGSGVYWQRHLKKHDAKSIHLWNSDWYYDTSIVRFATKFSNINKVVESKEWANLAIENGIQGGYLGEDVAKRASITRKETVSSEQWKSTVGKEHSRKISETKSDPKWKETVGKEAAIKIGKAHSELKQSEEWKSTVGETKIKKYKDVVYSEDWKETIGKQKSEKLSNIQNNTEWKATVGQEKIEKYLKRTNDPDWLATKGKERSKKQSEKAKNREKFECQYCNGMFWKTHLNRWHGENCKHKGL